MTAPKSLTKFQQRVVDAVRRCKAPAPSWAIAEKVSPNWRIASARGAIVAHIRRAALQLPELLQVLAPVHDVDGYRLQARRPERQT